MRLIIVYVFPFLAAEISTWLDHPRPAADATQLEELPGTWLAGPLVRTQEMEVARTYPGKTRILYISECVRIAVIWPHSMGHTDVYRLQMFYQSK